MSIQGLFSAYLASGGSNGLVLNGMCAPRPARIRSVAATAGAGGSTCVMDVTVNGVSVWTSAASRPTLSGAAGGKFTVGSINRTAVREFDAVAIVLATAGGKANVACTVALEDPEVPGG